VVRSSSCPLFGFVCEKKTTASGDDDGNVQLGFMLIALIWKFDFSPFMILVIAILNDGGLEIKTQHVS
jgi:hypothetical protein